MSVRSVSFAAALLVSSGSAEFQGLPKVRSFSNPPQFLDDHESDGGPDMYTCYGYLYNLAREVMTGNCPLTGDYLANCELACYQDLANMWRALDLAGCSDEFFSCMNTEEESERCTGDSDDEGSSCHGTSGNCLVMCARDEECNMDDDEYCDQGWCVGHPRDLEAPSLARNAALHFAGCGTRGDGVSCPQLFYQGWDFDKDPSPEMCDQFESWGCCMNALDLWIPGYASKCPGYQPVERCVVQWEDNYTSAFCDNCGSNADEEGNCGLIAPLLCEIGMGDKLSYCWNEACANYGQPGNEEKDEACEAATNALADKMCKEEPECKDCSGYERRRRLNFGGMPCC